MEVDGNEIFNSKKVNEGEIICRIYNDKTFTLKTRFEERAVSDSTVEIERWRVYGSMKMCTVIVILVEINLSLK